MELDKQEILRYLGAGHCSETLEAMITRAQKEIATAARPRHAYRLVSLEIQGAVVILEGTVIKSWNLAQHLAGCVQAFLFACTLGPGVDQLIKRYTIIEMPLVPVLQAVSTAYIEAYADQAQQEMEEYAQGKSLYLRPRYSPGYGDFSLSCQRLLFAALEITKKLGVSLTDDFLMVPYKSITSVVGLSPDPSRCHIHHCMDCFAKNCPFRKETYT